jgi:hypothetical protein
MSPSSYIAIECGHNSPANGFDTLICNKCAEQISCITSCGVEGGRGVQQKKRAFFGYFAASESSGELRFGKLKRCDHSHEVTTAADATRLDPDPLLQVLLVELQILFVLIGGSQEQFNLRLEQPENVLDNRDQKT